jgi:hypothetical protein
METKHQKNNTNEQGDDQDRDTEDTQETGLEVGEKMEDNCKGPRKSLCKKRKSHRVPTIYTLIDYDID